jgi:hypothetical protein
MLKVGLLDYHGKEVRVKCPECGDLLPPIPPDMILQRTMVIGKGYAVTDQKRYKNLGLCHMGHAFVIDDHLAYAVNDLNSKKIAHRDNRRILKNFEETPAHLAERPEKGKIILP